MAGLGRLQRGNFKDPRIRRNWQRLTLDFDSLLGDDFELNDDGKLTLVPHLFDAYDSVGMEEIGSSPETVIFDTVRVDTPAATYSYNAGTGELTFSTEGTFTVTVSVSAGLHNPVSDFLFEVEVFAELNNVAIEGSYGYGSNAAT